MPPTCRFRWMRERRGDFSGEVPDDICVMSTTGTRQIVGLDLIRAAAAVMVMFFHLGYWDWTKGTDPNAIMPRVYAPLAPVLSVGWIGVEIFFVLSGFVIAYSTEGATATRFLRHRVDRLLPTALICATMTAAVLLIAYPWQQVSVLWVKSVTFFPLGPWVDGSYWTLPIEVAFYGLVLLSLCIRKGHFLPLLMGVLGVASTGVNALFVFPLFGSPGWLTTLESGLGFPPLACLLLVHGCFFALGVFLFLTLLHRTTLVRVAMLLICSSGCFLELQVHSRNLAFASQTSRTALFPITAWSGCILALVCSVKANARLQSALGSKGKLIARQIGIATYPIYLLHHKLGQVAIGGLHRRVGYGAALLFSVTFVVCVAILVSWLLEPPLRSAFRKLWTVPRTIRMTAD